MHSTWIINKGNAKMIRSAFKQLLTQSPDTTVLIDHIFAVIKVLKARPPAPPNFQQSNKHSILFFVIREMIKWNKAKNTTLSQHPPPKKIKKKR